MTFVVSVKALIAMPEGQLLSNATSPPEEKPDEKLYHDEQAPLDTQLFLLAR
jgi:hypothetical protein